MPYNSLVKLFFLSPLLAFATACSSSFATKVRPDVDIRNYKTLYVERHAADERRIDVVIRDEINRLGLAATSGTPVDRPTNVDAIVTYEDRWMWDITMYMLSLQIDIRDASNNVLLATGKTSYTSLNRQSPAYMAREILMTIFYGKRPTGEENEAQTSEQAS